MWPPYVLIWDNRWGMIYLSSPTSNQLCQRDGSNPWRWRRLRRVSHVQFSPRLYYACMPTPPTPLNHPHRNVPSAPFSTMISLSFMILVFASPCTVYGIHRPSKDRICHRSVASANRLVTGTSWRNGLWGKIKNPDTIHLRHQPSFRVEKRQHRNNHAMMMMTMMMIMI